MLSLFAPERVDSFSAALELAKSSGKPIIVYAHGSDWCGHGEMLKKAVFDLESEVINVIFVDVDVLESPTDQNDERNNGFDTNQVQTYPSLIALTPENTRIGLRAGESLPNDPEGATTVLRVFAKDVCIRMALQLKVARAREKGNTNEEIAALHVILSQKLTIPAGLLQRLKEIDPEDSTGVRRRAEFGPFHQFVAQATRDSQEGRGEKAIQRLQAMLDARVYTKEQQAWIHNAMGSVYRYWEGHDIRAKKQFLLAALIAPESVPGIAGARLAEKLYPDTTVE